MIKDLGRKNGVPEDDILLFFITTMRIGANIIDENFFKEIKTVEIHGLTFNIEKDLQ